MLPNIWIIDTYSVMLILGVFACLFLFSVYEKKATKSNQYRYSIMILALIAIAAGLLSSILFQLVFDLLKGNGLFREPAMTFYGGLVGGVVCFLLIYQFKTKKDYPNESFIRNVMIIAPACITVAHGFGRIGCFLAGCCYGKETDSVLGMTFPGMSHAVYPTQLYEAIFLLMLSAILFLLAYKKEFKYTFPLYLFGYGTFRFLIEFIRGDERGAFLLGLSPAQWFSILAVLIGIGMVIYLSKVNLPKKDEE